MNLHKSGVKDGGVQALLAVFLLFLRIGMTAFGGPVAHLGYFHREFVMRRRWFSERNYADLVALCQFLPGPASSQAALIIGFLRAGYGGAVAAWAGFMLPSALALIVFAQQVAQPGNAIALGVLHGLKIVAVAVVAQAVWTMAVRFCTTMPQAMIMGGACCFSLLVPIALGPICVIIVSALVGIVFFDSADSTAAPQILPVAITGRMAGIGLGLFFGLLAGLPVLVHWAPNQTVALIDAFYRTGSLVFGGGHVVLPLLQAEVVRPGWVNTETFLTGYGAAQAIPGPLFTFAAFLGASMEQPPSGWLGGMICLGAIYLPSFLLVLGVLPFWDHLRRNARMQAALSGVNAAVVGVLLAALYRPIWISAIFQVQDFGLALLALAALTIWKLPSWLVVSGCAVLAGWGGL